MRNVPLDLKQKLLKRFYGASTQNLPQIQVIAKQASINTLITEVIHEDIPANFGDVAIRQLPGEAQPSLVYAICVDNGTGSVYSRKMPAFAEQEWEFVWSIGSVKDVAIEFDGEWRINPKKRFYELMTESVPYIFFTDNSNNLYVQKWSDSSTRIPLAENAYHISVCRGWQSTLDTGVDQGLIIGYLRDSKVFYRAYCQQSSGEYIWETENEVTELVTGNTTLCVFRTNDFRVGFLTENTGEMKYVLSERTYAGQAMPPEYAEGWPLDAKVWMNNIQSYYPVINESATVNIDKPYLGCYDKDTPELAATHFQRNGKREIIISFNRNVDGVQNVFQSYYTANPNKQINSTSFVDGKLKITFSEDLAPTLPYEMTVSKCHEAWQYIGNQKMPIEAMTIVVPGDPIQTIHREYAEVTVIDVQIRLNEKVMNYARLRESAVVSIADVTLTLTPVGVIPI
jgi:hypothetical protein